LHPSSEFNGSYRDFLADPFYDGGIVAARLGE